MKSKSRYYIVEASALPEVFLKVAEAKRLLSVGQANTVNDAAKMTGISRSAFYKYRDAILPFQNRLIAQIITFQLLLHDAPGALSGILNMLANFGTNIQTINSIQPTNSCALVTISADTSGLTISLEDLLHNLSEAPHVIKAEVLGG